MQHTPPAKIAIMLPRFSRYGGVEQFGYRLAEALAGRGHSVDFICARQEAEAPQGVRVVSVGRPRGPRSFKMLWFLVRAEQMRKKGGYDLSISLGKTWNQDISRMGGGPLDIFWEKSERALPEGVKRTKKRLRRKLSPSSWLTKLVEKHQFTEQSEVIAVSHLVREWLLEAHPELDPAKVQVVYNRPDPKRFYPPSAEEKAAAKATLTATLPRQTLEAHPNDLVTIGTASTNFELKGVAPLIRALAKLPDNTVLFVAGGREHGAYSELARSLGIEDRVVFCGKVDDMPNFYRGLDIFILPTFYDACSNAVLEALASGCKALTSSSNGAAYFLDESAILPDPGDVDDMAQRLAWSIEQAPPEPFVWPDETPTGLEAFVEMVEKKLEAKRQR